MSILQYKYKAHKLINTLFYVIVFVIGFVLGFGAKEINFSKLIGQLLMIDNVSALEYSNSIDYGDYIGYYYDYSYSDISDLPTSETYYNEDYIYDLFNEVMRDTGLNYNFSDYSNVFTIYWNAGVLENYHFYFSQSDYFGTYDNLSTSGETIMLSINNYSKSVSLGYYKLDDDYSEPIINLTLNSSFSGPSQMATTSNNITVGHYLDFEGVNLKFNENLFKDNPDFKEVCVPNNKDFVISTNNFELLEDENSPYNGTKSYSSYGFIWFPYYPKGLVSYLYDNSKSDNVWIPEEDDTYFDLHPIFHYWFDEKEEIDRVWSLEDPGSFLNSLGYTDKYSYFGWYTHPFVVRYANSGLRQFSIFKFNEDFEFYSTLENGIDYFEKLEEARNGNICFYIRKDFNINLLNTDEFGDKYGDITIMGDEKLEISTSVNISNLDSKGLFEKVKLFLNEMSEPIDFVKDYIFDLYDSMPYLLKLLIISVFGLIVIKILIGMVVR